MVIFYSKKEKKLTKTEKREQLRQQAIVNAAEEANEVETSAATDDLDDDWKTIFGFVDT